MADDELTGAATDDNCAYGGNSVKDRASKSTPGSGKLVHLDRLEK